MLFDFIIDERIISVGLLSSIFTATLIGSLKVNIIEPIFENIIPSQNLDVDPTQTDILNAGNYYPTSSKQIRWQTFLKDLLMWFVVIIILYIIYKIIFKNKNNST
jgi:large-conductance mechanosensitive channel